MTARTAVVAGLVLGAGTLIWLRRPAASAGPAPRPGPAHIVTVAGQRVLVAVPPGWRGRRTLLYLHGFGASIAALRATLVPHLAAIRDPAAIVIPQLGPKSEPGPLTAPGHAAALLTALGVPTGALDLFAHSGGYRAAAAVLRGGLAPRGVGLLDALYGETAVFAALAKRLVNVHGPSTAGPSAALAAVRGIDPGALVLPGPVLRLDPALVHAHAFVDVPTTVAHAAVPMAFGPAILEGFAP